MLPPHPSDAITPADLHPGACFTAADDRLYALGWPHLRYVVDGHKDDAKPLSKIPKLETRFTREFPRTIATRLVRRYAALDADNNWLDDAVVQVTENTDPIGVDEARALVAKQLAVYGRGHAWNVTDFLLLLEAMVGAAPLLEAIVSSIESFDRVRWDPDWSKTPWDHNPGCIALHAGLLLLRVPADTAAHYRVRLEALYAHGVREEFPRGEGMLLSGIDCALHGTEGVVRSLRPTNWRYLHWYFFVDDLDVLTTRMNDTGGAQWAPSARHLWLAGPQLIPVHEKHLRKVTAADIPGYLDDICKLAHPHIVDLVLGFVGKKAAKDIPLTWLRTHAKHARPRLEELAEATATKAKAKAEAAALALAAL